jgi:hypothetical protein
MASIAALGGGAGAQPQSKSSSSKTSSQPGSTTGCSDDFGTAEAGSTFVSNKSTASKPAMIQHPSLPLSAGAKVNKQKDEAAEGGASDEDGEYSPDKASSKGGVKKKKKPAKPQHLVFCSAKCRYAVIRKAVK